MTLIKKILFIIKKTKNIIKIKLYYLIKLIIHTKKKIQNKIKQISKNKLIYRIFWMKMEIVLE